MKNPGNTSGIGTRDSKILIDFKGFQRILNDFKGF